MKTRLLLLIIFLITSISNCYSQYFQDEEIEDTSFISPWLSNNTEDYEGVYFFGISEGETKISLAIEGDLVDFQIHNSNAKIDSNGEFVRWERNVENYTHVRIKGNKFYSNQTNGEFVTYIYGGKKVKCLKLDTPPIDTYDGSFELGMFTSKDKTPYFSGNHPITKFDVITLSKLRTFSHTELKIMRNEIFARYGYKFKKGGQMEKYFKTQKWYMTSNLDALQLLTQIEKANIKNIKIIETEKK
jgi:hypothetical protein